MVRELGLLQAKKDPRMASFSALGNSTAVTINEKRRGWINEWISGRNHSDHRHHAF